MQFLPILTLREGVIIAGAVVAVILFLWFVARLSHRPYFIHSQSEAGQLAVMQLGRIADSLDNLARTLENRANAEEQRRPDAPVTEEKRSGMSLSMFGR